MRNPGGINAGPGRDAATRTGMLMPLFRRKDGEYVAQAAPLRKLMPFLMRTRNESAVYFEETLDVTATLEWLEHRHREYGEPRINLFHLLLYAFVRVLVERPLLNQFVVGKRLYRRKNPEIAFAVKKQFTDEGALSTVKISFEPNLTLEEAVERIYASIKEGKGDQPTRSDQEVQLLTRLPRFLLSFIFWLQRTTDAFNLLPFTLIKDDPLYASLFVANLGSIGIDGAFHHLYEYGTVPLFCAIGTVKKMPSVLSDGTVRVRDVVTLRFTFDERIVDGYYCSQSLKLLKKWVEDPALLGC